jgi:multicomponent Na+:H+ antiporter subunit D
LLTPISIVGAALHVAAHAFGKITLFFAAGAIYTATHKTLVSQLDGVGRRMPWTLAAFAIASLSMIGLPPTAGLVSKWYIVSGAWQAQHWVALVVIGASTLLNAGYFLPIVYRAFLRDPPQGEVAHSEAPRTMVLALVATAALTMLMFFFSDLPIALGRGLLGV